MDTVRIISECDLTSEIDAAIRRTLVQCFPKDVEFFSRNRAWHGCAPSYSVLVLEGAEVIAHLGVVERRVTVGGVPVDVAGLQNVCVLPECRGRGLCRAVVSAAMDEANRRGLDCGLLFCSAELIPVYERCGWQLATGRAVVRVDSDGEEKPLPEGNVPMWYPLRMSVFPEGGVHLGGNDW
ncbi:MAG: GNAT family N-acetyltransferase [Planctomycetaceae bacterium]|nr:GNAT family N-acetyltransferase [Planctomycetaceae bacterium]